MKNRQYIFIVIALVVLSAVASYLHRILVVDRNMDRKYSFPVITDTVIPATGPIAELTNS